MSKLLGRLDWWRIQRLAFLVELIWAWFQFVFMALWSMSLLRLDPPLTMSSIEPFHRLFVNKILLFYFPFSEFLLFFSLFSLFTYAWHLACSFCIFVFIFSTNHIVKYFISNSSLFVSQPPHLSDLQPLCTHLCGHSRLSWVSYIAGKENWRKEKLSRES